MMLEIELKAYCDDLNDVVEKIEKQGGKFSSEEMEEDLYFNHPCRDFAKSDEAFRIRKTDTGSFVTYKGPKIGDKTKTRFEEEAQIDDPIKFKNILLKLGFIETGSVKKNRKSYTLGRAVICLDAVAGLGTFVELEIIGEDREESEKALFGLAEKLGLTRFERRSYLELALAR